LLGRARICGAGRGLELWRKLHSEWQGAAPQVIAAKSKRFQDPAKCGNILALWEALPAWEQLGAEVASGGYPLPDWLMANSLEKLLPDEMLKTVVGRPELADYAPKMAWVRAQMEYAKSNARAHHIAPAARNKRDHEDVDMGNLNDDLGGDDVMIANLHVECGRRAAAGDWQGVEHLANAICALSKGKGKGKGSFKEREKVPQEEVGRQPTPRSQMTATKAVRRAARLEAARAAREARSTGHATIAESMGTARTSAAPWTLRWLSIEASTTSTRMRALWRRSSRAARRAQKKTSGGWARPTR
jgi:hypothetical protein